jgi:hypothetical protein
MCRSHQTSHGPLCHPFELLKPSDVCGRCDRLRAAYAALLNQVVQLIFIARHKHELGASFCKSPRRRKTDPARRASNYNHLLFKWLKRNMHLMSPV